ncbi:hypothetical protein GCM10010309_52360 [Streptomyces violaceochromogenes]|nr:hypothetical protein GCM10010309_52360 [Streptomyces violaceochromogenes]
MGGTDEVLDHELRPAVRHLDDPLQHVRAIGEARYLRLHVIKGRYRVDHPEPDYRKAPNRIIRRPGTGLSDFPGPDYRAGTRSAAR